jgi:hypothetical protein
VAPLYAREAAVDEAAPGAVVQGEANEADETGT